MYRLSRVTLINWYLFQAEDIDFGRHTVIFGGNGAGKSALLDAIQCCMMGADHSTTKLNSRSEDARSGSNDRTIQSYMLGRLKTGNTRNSARTYLVLGFERDLTGEKITIGLAMKASAETPREDVEARFVVKGDRLLTADDFSSRTATQFLAHDWKQIRSELEAQGMDVEVLPRASEFRRTYLRILNGGAKGFGIKDARFTRILRQTLEFKTGTIRDVSTFMRQSVLPDDSLPIDVWRQQYRGWQDMLDRLARSEAEHKAVKAIEEVARLALENEISWQATNWLESYDPYMTNVRAMIRARTEMRQKASELSDLEYSQAKFRNRRDEARRALDLARQEQNSSPEAERINRLEERGNNLRTELARAETAVDRVRDALGTVPRAIHELASDGMHDAPYRAAAGELAQILGLGPRWETRWEDLFGHFERLRNSDLREVVKDFVGGLAAEQGRIKKEVDEITRLRTLARDKQDPVPTHIGRLLAEMRRKDLKARTLSSMVDIKPQFGNWRGVTEAILGDMCHGIVVPPDQVEEAIAIMRKCGDRATIVRTNLLKTENARIDPDSLAFVCEVSDPLARAIVIHQLGQIKRVTTEAELKSVSRGATDDGLFSHGIVTRPVRMLPRQLYGSGAEAIGANLEQRLAALAPELNAATGAMNRAQAAMIRLENAFQAVPADRSGMDALFWEVKSRKRDIAENEENLAAARAKISPELGEKIASCERELADCEGQLVTLSDEIRKADREHEALKGKFQSAMERRHQFRTRLKRLKHEAGLLGYAAELPGRAEELRSRIGDNGAGESLAVLQTRFKGAMTRERNRFTEARRKYLDQHEPKLIPDLDGEPALYLRGHADWAASRAAAIERDALRPYRDQVRQAADLFLETTRSAFLEQISVKISELIRIQNELNANLRNGQFNGVIYQISRDNDRELSPFINLAERVKSGAADAVLSMDFIEKNPDNPDVQIIRRMMDMLTAEAGDDDPIRRLVDPRNYFEFDLELYDAPSFAGVSRSKPIGRFSKLVGGFSGGEKDVPFYICLGVAMAMTYFGGIGAIHSVNKSGVVLLDEAFNKLEPMNVAKVIDYYKNLGLQIICVAPSTNKPVYFSKMDKVLVLTKAEASRQVHVESIIPSLKAREMLVATIPPEPVSTV